MDIIIWTLRFFWVMCLFFLLILLFLLYFFDILFPDYKDMPESIWNGEENNGRKTDQEAKEAL